MVPATTIVPDLALIAGRRASSDDVGALDSLDGDVVAVELVPLKLG